MNYIEIANGISINVDKIEAIGYGQNELTSKVHTHHNVYDSTFPYSILLDLLERSGHGMQEKEKENKEIMNIFKEIGTVVP